MARRRPAARKRNYKAEYKRRVKREKLSGRVRDYKAEYRRRKYLAIERQTAADAKRVFGYVPHRKHDHPDTFTYEEFLADKKKREGRFDWTDEANFVKAITDLGLTAREAYTLWFSS